MEKRNQSMTWRFSVNEDGWYKLGMRCLQNWNDGLAAYRSIKIDGEIPFAEMTAYRFDYLDKWKIYNPGGFKFKTIFVLSDKG